MKIDRLQPCLHVPGETAPHSRLLMRRGNDRNLTQFGGCLCGGPQARGIDPVIIGYCNAEPSHIVGPTPGKSGDQELKKACGELASSPADRKPTPACSAARLHLEWGDSCKVY
jgi:hypothetical protein